MVLSSINTNGLPQSAVVGFGVTNDLKLVFGTSAESRKAKNIAGNKNVSVVIGWDNQGTVQYEGTARQLKGEEVNNYTEIYYSKNESARAYKDDPNERYFLIEPAWIRYTDVSKNPWAISEFKFS